jgi:putative transposase
MPRIARVVAVGIPHHITQRGNKRESVFFTDDDRQTYLRLLASYCLMSNHVHLVAIPEKSNALAKAIGRTHNDYARWLNVRQRQVGHLWQNRFHSCPMQLRHLWDALRYVELNPVRAGLVREAWEWKWSSAACHAGLCPAPEWLDQALWRDFWQPVGWRVALQEGLAAADLWERIREATAGGRPLGDERFTAKLEEMMGCRLRRAKPGPKPKAAAGAAG